MTDYNEKVDELISRMAKAENTLAGSLHRLDLLENKVNGLKEQILVLEETKSAGTITRDIGSMSTEGVVKELIKRDSVQIVCVNPDAFCKVTVTDNQTGLLISSETFSHRRFKGTGFIVVEVKQ
jgi:predicted RNA-binding protein